MTLILGLVTPEFAIQVSDRQLTNGRTGRPLITRASKTVLVPQPQFMVSYTGLAEIEPNTSTDAWLMKTLWDIRDSSDYFGELAKAATTAFAKIRAARSLKRHSFLVSGWVGSGELVADAQLPKGVTPSAYHVLVSNSFDFEAGVELHAPTDSFTHRAQLLYPSEAFKIRPAGVPLTTAETHDLHGNVAAALRSRGGAERAAALVMARTVEEVAQRRCPRARFAAPATIRTCPFAGLLDVGPAGFEPATDGL